MLRRQRQFGPPSYTSPGVPSNRTFPEDDSYMVRQRIKARELEYRQIEEPAPRAEVIVKDVHLREQHSPPALAPIDVNVHHVVAREVGPQTVQGEITKVGREKDDVGPVGRVDAGWLLGFPGFQTVR